jgi:hypothetical protein
MSSRELKLGCVILRVMASNPTIVQLGTVHHVAIGEVKPCEHNPRKIPQRAIDIVAKSLEEFGWQQPLVTDAEGVLVVGHTRWLAAKQLKAKTVPVVVASGLTPAQIEAYRIADNRTGDYSDWDYVQLVKQLEELSEDFSEVLGLADWQSIVDRFEEITGNGEKTDEVPGLSLSDETTGTITDEMNCLVVTFSDEASKIAAERVILDLPGVVDVRRKS